MANQKIYQDKKGGGISQWDMMVRRKRALIQMETDGLLDEDPSTIPAEKEADQAAEQIVSGNGIDASELSKSGTQLQGKAKDQAIQMENSISDPLTSSKGSGQVLEDSIKDEMEDQMNTDLGDVRVHTDTKANQMSEDINAKAFTHGRDIYFNKGNYNPNSAEGKNLLAHELAHTQQERGGVQRKIDEKGSWRIIQGYLGFNAQITGDQKTKDTQDRLKEKGWTDDKLILKGIFEKVVGKSIEEQKDVLEKTNVDEILKMIKIPLDAAAKFDVQWQSIWDKLTKIDSLKTPSEKAKVVLGLIPQVFDINAKLLGKIKKGIPEEDVEQIELENFDLPLEELEEVLEAKKDLHEISKEGVAENPNNLELLANKVSSKMPAIEKLIPEEIKLVTEVEEAISEAQNWEKDGDYLESQEINASNIGDFSKQIIAAITDKATSLRRNLDRKNKSDQVRENIDILVSWLEVYLGDYLNALSRFVSVNQGLAEAYKVELEKTKEFTSGSFVEGLIEKRKKRLASSDEVARFQSLIQLVIDYMDVDMEGANIAAVHFDKRVDTINSTNPIEKVFPQAKGGVVNGIDKIEIDKKLMGIVVFEVGNLKVVKLGTEAFDSWQAMKKVIDLAIIAKPPKDLSLKVSDKTKKFSKFDKLVAKGKFLPDEASKINTDRLNDKRSVRIIMDIINGPEQEQFDRQSSYWIYDWQSNKDRLVTKPKQEVDIGGGMLQNDRGVIREEDMKAFFNILSKGGAESKNAMILLALDYYNLAEQVLQLESSDFQLEMKQYKALTKDETFLSIHYQNDVLPEHDQEAGANFANVHKVPGAIKIGNDSFRSLTGLVHTLAHELTHARQNLGEKTSSQEHEIYAYWANVSDEFGKGFELPKHELLSDYTWAMLMASEYYASFKEAKDLVAHSAKMADFIAEVHKNMLRLHWKSKKPYNRDKFMQFIRISSSQDDTRIGDPGTYEPIEAIETMSMLESMLSFVNALGQTEMNKLGITPLSIEKVILTAQAFAKPSYTPNPDLGPYKGKLPSNVNNNIRSQYSNFRNSIMDQEAILRQKVEEKLKTMPTGSEKTKLKEKLEEMKKIFTV
ncbi:MAG: DUF4157 domain-containing protein [Flavobacteriales bacterium]|nr:DUF4157 domain-containing protein [Flavobacteriales bacterium]